MRNNELAGLRGKFNVSQDELASCLGINRVTYNKKENGEFEFKEGEMKKILLFFKKKDKRIKAEDIFFN